MSRHVPLAHYPPPVVPHPPPVVPYYFLSFLSRVISLSYL